MQVELLFLGLMVLLLSVCWLSLVIVFIPGTLILEALGLLALGIGGIGIVVDVLNFPLPSLYQLVVINLMEIFVYLMGSCILFLIFFRLFMPKGWWRRHLVLKSSENGLDNKSGWVSPGAIGVVLTPLVPTGRVNIGGILCEARLVQGVAKPGQSIRVVSCESITNIIVEVV